MLWVYGHDKYFYSYSAGIDFSRQNLTSTDVRFWLLKSIPALYKVKSLHLNTYVMGLGSLLIFYSVFYLVRGSILDVKFWREKSNPALKGELWGLRRVQSITGNGDDRKIE